METSQKPRAVIVRSRNSRGGEPLFFSPVASFTIRRTCMRAFIFKVMGLLLLVPALASSQTYQGGVRGAVRDADGGVLPGTSVTLTRVQTGITRTSVTNERGEYVFASVAPGTYNVAVELSGFAPFLREGLLVGVQDFLVQDVTMVVG